MVTAGYAHTMQSLTGGRFVLGLGRGIARMQDAFGLDRITTAQMEDFAGIMRRLFRGEVIIGHDGPAGEYPVLHLNAGLDEVMERLGDLERTDLCHVFEATEGSGTRRRPISAFRARRSTDVLSLAAVGCGSSSRLRNRSRGVVSSGGGRLPGQRRSAPSLR